MMRLRQISAGYRKDQPVLRDIDLHLQEGGFYFLTGPSGAGKSTLLRVLSLTLAARQGEFQIFGENIRKVARERMPLLRRQIGLVFQDYQLLPHLSILDNVALPLKVTGEDKAKCEAKAKELLEWVGLEGCEKNLPATLSGGMKQRAAIARAVINSPKILLADEPTGNLDPELAMKIMYLFQALNQMGTSILFATHDEYLISQFDYPVLRIENGTLINAPKRYAVEDAELVN